MNSAHICDDEGLQTIVVQRTGEEHFKHPNDLGSTYFWRRRRRPKGCVATSWSKKDWEGDVARLKASRAIHEQEILVFKLKTKTNA